jgi:hypothetical protein
MTTMNVPEIHVTQEEDVFTEEKPSKEKICVLPELVMLKKELSTLQ